MHEQKGLGSPQKVGPVYIGFLPAYPDLTLGRIFHWATIEPLLWLQCTMEAVRGWEQNCRKQLSLGGCWGIHSLGSRLLQPAPVVPCTTYTHTQTHFYSSLLKQPLMRRMLLRRMDVVSRPHYWTQGPFFQKKKLGCFSDVLVPTCGLKHKTTRLLSNTEQDLTDAINDNVTHFIIPTLKFVGSSLIGVKKNFGTRTLVSPMPDMIPLLLLVQSLVAGSKKG